jgi:acetyltransferase-like isoleucine patch superfamily enzyme
LAPRATVGQFNWVTAASELRDLSATAGHLLLQNGAAVTNRHYLDCSGGIRVGSYATVAGVRSVLISHAIDTEYCYQDVAQIEIGDFSLVSSNVKIVPGAQVPKESVIGMGAVVQRGLSHPGFLYAGVPAEKKKKLHGAYFNRADPRVSPRA